MNYVFVSENLLVDWFILIHKKNMLVRRDAELVYMWVHTHTHTGCVFVLLFWHTSSSQKNVLFLHANFRTC